MTTFDSYEPDERPFAPLPTDNEQLVLLALAAQQNFANIIEIAESISSLTDESVQLAQRTIHKILMNLEEHNVIEMSQELKSVFGEGRPKYMYLASPSGFELLKGFAHQYRARAELIEGVLRRWQIPESE